jgi:16S rRNA (guanine(1405)-N(7))-methyltransferase
MSPASPDQLAELVRLVKQGNKYASIDDAVIVNIGTLELNKRSFLKEAVKTTRNKLHQVGAAYQEKPIPYPAWKKQLMNLPKDLANPEVQEFLRSNMRLHASTSERLSIHETFFKQTLAEIGPVTSILDLACGLNPLNLPWLPLAGKFEYYACDIYTDMVEYLNAFFMHFEIHGAAQTCDLTRTIPEKTVQLAMLLKTIPCLEQVDKTAGKRLLEDIHTENILVSFPAHSLGGRSKGMVQNYEAHFRQLTQDKNWRITRFEFPGELAFLIRK